MPPPVAPPAPEGSRPRSLQRPRKAEWGLTAQWARFQRGSFPALPSHAASLTTPLALLVTPNPSVRGQGAM